jgi:protein TilB
MVERITRELLKKRAEHNDGILSTLKEITLHQFDLEKLENLDLIPQVEILYLQNNQISKIENLTKLKSLKYLQLALNNISKIENLTALESLEKLDLTVNFVKNPMDVLELVGLEHLRELYLTGNPCSQVKGYRKYVITVLPQLKILDSKEITTSERIEARQEFNEIQEYLLQQDFGNSEIAPAAEEHTDIESKREEFQTKLTKHTPESRLQAARDWDLLKNEKKLNQNVQKEVVKEEFMTKDGRVLQKNQGKWDFKWSETAKTLILDVKISKFIDTSLLDVDLHENYIRITIKDKILQLTTTEPVHVDSVLCERSKATGHLLITMVKSKILEKDLQKIRKEENLEQESLKKMALQEKSKENGRNRRYERLFEPKEAVNIRNILEQVKLDQTRELKRGIVDVKTSEQEKVIPSDFVDDPDVPPLC